MRVAIWGSYNHSNYGDDVMAIMFAKAVSDLNAEPLVFRLDAALAAQYNIAVTHSIDELLAKAHCCVIGGGGMLVGENFIRLLLRKQARDFELDFRTLLNEANRCRCPILPISIGGDGRGVSNRLPFWRRKLFENKLCQRATVRLREDLALMQSLGVDARYFPDILLSVADHWQIRRKEPKARRLRVGINLLIKTGSKLAAELYSLLGRRNDIEFVYFRTHLPRYKNFYEILPDKESSRVKVHTYEDPKSLLNEISTLDVLISSKLHLGVSALSMGIPFFSFAGKKKTFLFMKSMQLEDFVWLQGGESDLIDVLVDDKALAKRKAILDRSAVAKAKEQCTGHFSALSAQLKY